MSEDLDTRVAALRKEGRYEEAAQLCVAAGDAARASRLLADVWNYEGAIRIAESAAMFDLAYEHALAGNQREAAARLLMELTERPEQALRAARHAEGRGRLIDAARLLEAAAEIGEAAAAYERAGELFDAARLHEADGDYRKAGLLYERRVREFPDDGEAALRLGRILAHFGRFEHAVRALQTAAEDDERREPAVRLMIACFAALGMDEAAGSRLDELRRGDASVPVTVPEFLEAEFGDPRGLAGLVAAESEATLLAGRYRVVRPLGAGATGRVLLAHDGFYDREVAVKVLTVGAGGAGRDAYVRFAREARVAAGLEHPNVVRVFEFNADGPFLVMELMEGGTLEERLAGGERISPPVVRSIVLAILAGLEAVHRRGVVHRDLKPANVFFGATRDVKIGDFGVAHLADLGATLTGAMLGTLAYMAPEQITGASKPDASTDLYALGVIVHRMLTGELPFPGPDFVTQHLQQPPPKPSSVVPALGDRFDELVLDLLAKEVQRRPRTAGEVRARVEALDWSEPDLSAVELATGVVADRVPPKRKDSTIPPPPDARYTPLEGLPGGGMLARDELLLRPVRIEPCDPPRAQRLRAFARADGPHLQAVYELDEEDARAIVEQPEGVRWGEREMSAERRRRALSEIRSALETLHRFGVVHGSVSADTVLVSDGRAVLLLPSGGEGPADRQIDLQALARLERV